MPLSQQMCSDMKISTGDRMSWAARKEILTSTSDTGSSGPRNAYQDGYDPSQDSWNNCSKSEKKVSVTQIINSLHVYLTMVMPREMPDRAATGGDRVASYFLR